MSKPNYGLFPKNHFFFQNENQKNKIKASNMEKAG